MAQLSNDQNSDGRYFRFLIDSGSDYTLIPKSAATLLGIDYNKIPKEKTNIETANLQSFSAKRTELYLKLNHVRLKIPVLIYEEEIECLLGRKGVFERFDITFRENQQKVIFKKSIHSWFPPVDAQVKFNIITPCPTSHSSPPSH